MKSRIQDLGYLFVFLLIASAPGQTVAEQKASVTKQGSASTSSYSWYDGNRKRTIWLNPDLIAEFDPKPAGHAQSKSLSASARPIKSEQASIRIWRVDSTISGKSAQQIASQLPAGKLSPVLQDGQSENTRKRALPGNIIVHLNPDWNRQEVNNWLAKNSLQMIKPLNIGPNIFVIQTGPGLQALEKANALYLSGEVIAAYPDWWIEVQKK